MNQQTHCYSRSRYIAVRSQALLLCLCLLAGLLFAGQSAYAEEALINVAMNKSVAARLTSNNNNAYVNPDRPLAMAVDGTIPTGSSAAANYADFGSDDNRQSIYFQVDFSQVYDIVQIKIWRYWNDGRTYDATVIALSETPDFSSPVIVYNSDTNNVHGFGAGSNSRYAETRNGRTFDLPEAASARYLRVYTYGVQNGGTTNHIVELEAYAYESPPLPGAFANASEPLYIKCPTLPANRAAWIDNSTHPDMVVVPGGWNGYKYWMGFTPNITGSSYYENPSIAASNDGIHWEYPAANPVQPRFDSAVENETEHYCDTDLLYDIKNDRMILYYEWTRDSGSPAESAIQYRVSYDGVKWGTPIDGQRDVATGDRAFGVAVQTSGSRYSDLSPAIVYDAKRDVYLMWANDAGNVGYNNGNLNKVWVRWSSDGLSGWSDKQYVNNLLGLNENGIQLYPWHLDVQYIDELQEFWAVIQSFPSGTNPNSSTLRMSKSKDGLNWEPVGNQPMLRTSTNSSAWDYGQIYRTTFWYEPAENGAYAEGMFHLWYSALSQGNTYWKIGYTSNSYLSAMKSLTVNANYEQPPVVEATALSLGADRDLAINKVLALDPVFTPANTTSRLIRYTSSDPSVATVDPFGNVMPLQMGTTVITGKVNGNGATASFTLTVRDKDPKRYRVDNEHPLLVMPVYGAKSSKTGYPTWDTGELDWGDTLEGRWETVPDDLKPYTIMEIHPGGEIGTYGRLEQLQTYYKLILDKAEAAGIPVILVVATAGQQPQYTGTVGLTEEYLNSLFQQYSCLKGLMSTENYWTNYTTVANESLKFLKVAAENGGFFMWSEHMVNVLESINANATLRQAMAQYGDSFIMTFKNTPVNHNPGSASIIQGMWLTGLCDQWGGLMDTWKWYEKRYWKLFETTSLPGGTSLGEEARCVVSEPEALLYSEMLNVYLNGGCVYNFEHPGYTYGSNNEASPAFTNAIMQFMRYAVGNPAPSKESVVEKTKAVIHAGSGSSLNFNNIQGTFYRGLYCEDVTNPTYTTGRYGLIPVIVKEVTDERIRECLPNAAILTRSSPELATQQAKVDFFKSRYPEEYIGNAFGQYVDGIWYFYNSNVNTNINQTATVSQDGLTVSMEIEPHTNVRLDASAATGKMNVYINNYRVDKDPIWAGYTSSTQRWNTDTNMLMEAYMADYTANPLDNIMRPTVFTLTGLPFAPAVRVNADRSLAGQYETPTVAFEDGVAVITIMSNGYVDFDLLLDEPKFEISYRGFTQLVAGCAANIPVMVEADNPDGLDVFVGLFVDGDRIAEAKIVNGTAVIKASAVNGETAYLAAWFVGRDPELASKENVPVVDLPVDIWTPAVQFIDDLILIAFGDDISLTATAFVTVDGAPVTGFKVGSERFLEIPAPENDGVSVIVVKGVKYPLLFPSYSFTFTIEVKG